MAWAWVILGLCGLLFAACWAAGLWIGGRSKPVALAAAAITLALIALRVLFRFRPEIEYSLLSSNLYSAIRPLWVFPFALISLGIGARRMSRRPLRAAVEIAAVAVLAFALQAPWARATFDPGDYAGAPDCDGVCLQTQEFTCGPAAAATLLTQIGIPTNEEEMEQLCRATPVTGTDEIAVCRALRMRLSGTGLRVTLERPGLDRLARHLWPVLARIKSDLLRDHWVVLLAMNDHTAVLGTRFGARSRFPRANSARIGAGSSWPWTRRIRRWRCAERAPRRANVTARSQVMSPNELAAVRPVHIHTAAARSFARLMCP